jgi:hypothetical protein
MESGIVNSDVGLVSSPRLETRIASRLDGLPPINERHYILHYSSGLFAEIESPPIAGLALLQVTSGNP